MQLFVTDFEKKGDNVKITNIEILNQVRKVLRMKIGDSIFIQKENIRYKIQITDRDNENIFGIVLDTIKSNDGKNTVGLAIAMPNKRDKLELIVQKLTEIGIKNIYFRPSERSVIKERNEKKAQRINKIAKEAIEQSRGRFLPKISFEKDFSKIVNGKDIVVFDKCDNLAKQGLGEYSVSKQMIGIVGPEGGFTSNDYTKFGNQIKTVSLGDTVLRTETASIIAAWFMKNFN